MIQNAVQLGDMGIHVASHYYNAFTSTIYKVALFSIGVNLGVALARFGVEQFCPYPWGECKEPGQIFFDAGAYDGCLKQREIALIDPAHPPLDWNDDIQQVCQKEAEIPLPICEVEIHQTGVCKGAYREVDAVHAVIQKISEHPNQIVHRLWQAAALGNVFTFLHFAINRVIQRIR